MYFIKLIPFSGLALAVGHRAQELREVPGLLDDNGGRLLDALNHANATGTSQVLAYNQATAVNVTQDWMAIVEISVTEDFPASQDPSDDLFEQVTAFSIKAEDGSPASEQSSSICFSVIEGLNKEATEEGQESEPGACGMIPITCQEELASRLWSLEDKGCPHFARIVVPKICDETFPQGFITTYNVPTRELGEDGYFFIHETAATKRGSNETEIARADLRKKIWPVFMMTSRQAGAGTGLHGGDPICLRASGPGKNKEDKSSDKTDGNDESKKDGDGKKDGSKTKDEEPKEGTAGANGFSAMGVFVAALVALVAAF